MIFSYIPRIDSIGGIIFYSLIAYIILFLSVSFVHYLIDFESNRSVARARKNIIVRREAKRIEADKLLKKL